MGEEIHAVLCVLLTEKSYFFLHKDRKHEAKETENISICNRTNKNMK